MKYFKTNGLIMDKGGMQTMSIIKKNPEDKILVKIGQILTKRATFCKNVIYSKLCFVIT